jgi:hypothetical protein
MVVVKMAEDHAGRRQPKTLTVPEAGKIYFNLSKGGSYDAAQRGDIPTIRIGRLLRVSVAIMERIIGAS